MLLVMYYSVEVIFFFFKQKTAYEMRISDWSSDVCSSDLVDTIVRDLVEISIKQTREHATKRVRTRAQDAAEERILDVLVGFQEKKIGRASCRERVCQYV